MATQYAFTEEPHNNTSFTQYVPSDTGMELNLKLRQVLSKH